MRERALFKYALVVCVSLALAISDYLSNPYLIPIAPRMLDFGLFRRTLLIAEGLLILLIGAFLLIPRETRIQARALSVPPRSVEVTSSAVFVTLTLILTGTVLIFLAFI